VSRADWVEHVGLPNAEARNLIISEVVTQLATKWSRIGDLRRSVAELVSLSDGLDGRQLRKAILAALASTIEVAKDPNKLRREHVIETLRLAREARTQMEAPL